MNKFKLEFDGNNNPLSITLVLESSENADIMIERLKEYDEDKFIDVTTMNINDAWKVITGLSKNQTDIYILVDDSQINEDLISNMNNIEDIDFKDDIYQLKLGKENINLIRKYKVLSLNIRYKEKSYELEIVESLLREYDKNNEIITQLQREKQQLQQFRDNTVDDELETRYLDLMEKYKQSLKRLDQLRSSKLGKLQVAYWNQKRGY